MAYKVGDSKELMLCMSELMLLSCLEKVIFMFFFVSRATPPPDLRKEWVLERLVKL